MCRKMPMVSSGFEEYVSVLLGISESVLFCRQHRGAVTELTGERVLGTHFNASRSSNIIGAISRILADCF